jgi:hypothetical protein
VVSSGGFPKFPDASPSFNGNDFAISHCLPLGGICQSVFCSLWTYHVGGQSVKRYNVSVLSGVDIRCSRLIDVRKKVKKNKQVSLMDDVWEPYIELPVRKTIEQGHWNGFFANIFSIRK